MSVDIYSLVNAKVKIQRPVRSQGAAGEPKSVYVTIAQGVPCYIEQDSGSEAVIYSAERNRNTGTAFFLSGQSIDQEDRIIWGSRILDVQSVDTKYETPDIVSHIEVRWEETL